jgi:hypothetical protein
MEFILVFYQILQLILIGYDASLVLKRFLPGILLVTSLSMVVFNAAAMFLHAISTSCLESLADVAAVVVLFAVLSAAVVRTDENTKQFTRWFLLLSVVPLCCCAPARPAGLGFDPAKRIPLLTDSNYTEWSWRVAAALIAMGVSATILTQSTPSADLVEAPNAAAIATAVSNAPAVKAARTELAQARLRVQLHQDEDDDDADSLDDKKADKALKKTTLKAAEEAAKLTVMASIPLLVACPFDGLPGATLVQCFQLIVRTISC